MLHNRGAVLSDRMNTGVLTSGEVFCARWAIFVYIAFTELGVRSVRRALSVSGPHIGGPSEVAVVANFVFVVFVVR